MIERGVPAREACNRRRADLEREVCRRDTVSTLWVGHEVRDAAPAERRVLKFPCRYIFIRMGCGLARAGREGDCRSRARKRSPRVFSELALKSADQRRGSRRDKVLA